VKNGLLKSLVLLSLSLSSASSFADLVDCGKRDIRKVMINGDRDDGLAHANSLVIMISDSTYLCNGKTYIYMKNDHPAYSSMLSTALAAKHAKQELYVYVNSSKVLEGATEIAILSNE